LGGGGDVDGGPCRIAMLGKGVSYSDAPPERPRTRRTVRLRQVESVGNVGRKGQPEGGLGSGFWGKLLSSGDPLLSHGGREAPPFAARRDGEKAS